MQYAPLIRILLQKETRTLFFCGVAVLLFAVLVGCIIQKLRKQKAKKRSIRLMGGLFATSVILCLCVIQFGLSVRQRYLLSLDYRTLDVCQMEATLQARKRHLLWKGSIYCRRRTLSTKCLQSHGALDDASVPSQNQRSWRSNTAQRPCGYAQSTTTSPARSRNQHQRIRRLRMEI